MEKPDILFNPMQSSYLNRVLSIFDVAINTLNSKFNTLFDYGGALTVAASGILQLPKSGGVVTVTGTGQNITGLSLARQLRRVVLVSGGGITFVHSATFRMKSGANKTPAIGEVSEFAQISITEWVEL